MIIRTFAMAATIAACAVTLSACGTTGQYFDARALARVVPGQTSLAQADALFGAPPVTTYDQGDGSVLARWAYKGSAITDALYVRQELWLLFGSDGRFERVVRKVNVLANPASAPAGAAGAADANSMSGAAGTEAAPRAPAGAAPPDRATTYPIGPH
ncbi:MAG: hypothetical protein EPN41_07830 [Candidimonas sp.]|nr:MAG: hypothetical protein EPN41_07830 [Candidimonas sp.]